MRILALFKGTDKWHNLEKALAHSFGRIKSETSLIFSWLHYFREKDKVHDDRHYHTQQQIQHHDRTIDKMKEEIFALKSEVLQLKVGQERTQIVHRTGSFPNLVRTKSEPERQSAFESKMLAKIRHQRKAYVMDQIMKLIEKGIHSTKEIETTIVKEKALCGRTAFYDYLRELKHKNLIKYEEKGIKRTVIMA
jgi:hypothetical protein